MLSYFAPGHWQTFAALRSYCSQLTTRGSPPCYLCGDLETYLPIGSNHQEDLATPGFVHWRQTLANRTLALHLPGGRQLFVKTCSALWIQQCSSGVCYNRRRKVVGIWGLCQNVGMTTAFYCLFHRIWPPLSELLYMLCFVQDCQCSKGRDVYV